jgi:hypothetical protein
MAGTSLELFRAGNTTSPRMDRVRQDDVEIYDVNGIEWVRGRVGGMSTQTAIDPALGGRWWRLPAGSNYDDRLLFVVNDDVGHWAWQSSFDMPLADYRAALSAVSARFRLV